MSARATHKPRGWRGWLTLAAMLPWIVFFRLPVWWIRGIRARRCLWRELCLSGVPPEAARQISSRYRFPAIRQMFFRRQE